MCLGEPSCRRIVVEGQSDAPKDDGGWRRVSIDASQEEAQRFNGETRPERRPRRLMSLDRRFGFVE